MLFNLKKPNINYVVFKKKNSTRVHEKQKNQYSGDCHQNNEFAMTKEFRGMTRNLPVFCDHAHQVLNYNIIRTIKKNQIKRVKLTNSSSEVMVLSV